MKKRKLGVIQLNSIALSIILIHQFVVNKMFKVWFKTKKSEVVFYYH